MGAMYRDDRLGARLRLEHLLDQRAFELPLGAQTYLSVHSARVARIAFGVTLCLGAFVMLTCAVAALIARKSSGGVLSAVLVGSWPVALCAYGLSRLFSYDLAR